MTYNIDESVIARSVDHYGEEIQATVCMEECAELIQAISKYMTFQEKLLMEPKCTMHQKKFMNTFCAAFVQ